MISNLRNILELILAFFAVIGGITTAIIFLDKKRKSYINRVNSFFSQSWRNEGLMSKTLPSHFLYINLKCAKDNLSGTMDIRDLKTGHTWHAVGIRGKRTFSNAKCKIYGFRNQEEVVYGTVTLKRKGDSLEWKLQSGSKELFPDETMIFT